MASEQSSREVLKRPLVAALTPNMKDAAIRATFRDLHNSLLPLSMLADILSVRCQGVRGVPLGMIRIRPEYLDVETSDPSIAAEILVREEPDEEEEDEEENEEDNDNEEGDDGYSERPSREPRWFIFRFGLRDHRRNKSRQAQTLE
jgi:hypothetical protein